MTAPISRRQGGDQWQHGRLSVGLSIGIKLLINSYSSAASACSYYVIVFIRYKLRSQRVIFSIWSGLKDQLEHGHITLYTELDLCDE